MWYNKLYLGELGSRTPLRTYRETIMSTTPNVNATNSSVQNLINSKTVVLTDKPEAAEKPIRFVVTFSVDNRNKLEKLAKILGTGQIKLASELLACALTDATNTYDRMVEEKKKAAIDAAKAAADAAAAAAKK